VFFGARLNAKSPRDADACVVEVDKGVVADFNRHFARGFVAMFAGKKITVRVLV
jgi:hypothetical protein